MFINSIGRRKVVKADGGDVGGRDLIGGEGSGGGGSVSVIGGLVLRGKREAKPID